MSYITLFPIIRSHKNLFCSPFNPSLHKFASAREPLHKLLLVTWLTEQIALQKVHPHLPQGLAPGSLLDSLYTNVDANAVYHGNDTIE